MDAHGQLPNNQRDNEMKTIRVIPALEGVMPNGQRVSPFSAGAVDVVNTGKYTWELVDYMGNVTQGLGRRPVDWYEAQSIMHEFALKFNYDIIK